ncbi:MAG: hypothetical protein HYR89_10575 [Actinobacteria bacterium]|nr:hypothetical protein [Actinomycetota bacterium]
MSVTTHVATVEQRAVFIKRASPGASAARLAHEAEMLAHAAGHGVVEMVEFLSDADGAALVTCFVGGGTLAELACRGRVDPEVVANVAATLCETLASAHDRGLVHGRVSAEHVLAPASVSPVLCGWAEAAVIGGSISHVPSRATSYGKAERDDLVGVARLVIEMLGESTGVLARQLRAVARRVPPETASGRGAGTHLSMATMAGAFRALVPAEAASQGAGTIPATVLLGRAIHGKPDVGGRRSRSAVCGWRRFDRGSIRGTPLGLAGVAVLLVALVVGVFHELATSEDPASLSSGTPVGADECGSEMPSTRLLADVDGDGCVEPIRLEGGIARAGGVSWRIGAEGDLVVIGDWNGDGTATPGLVRSTTGEVWIFQGWARHGEQLVARRVATQPIARARTAAVIEREGGDHDAIEVTDAEGAHHVIFP